MQYRWLNMLSEEKKSRTVCSDDQWKDNNKLKPNLKKTHKNSINCKYSEKKKKANWNRIPTWATSLSSK